MQLNNRNGVGEKIVAIFM